MNQAARCVEPGAIEDWELEAYREGTARPEVAIHLAQCAACRGRVVAGAAIEERLRSLLSRAICPTPQALHAYYWGELPASEYRAVQVHLQRCTACARELQALAEFVAPDTELPWKQVWTHVREVAAQVRWMVAQLRRPSAQPVFALRGEIRQVLLFEAGTRAVSVNVEQESTGDYALFGQVLTETLEELGAGQVRLTQPGGWVQQSPLNAQGGFVLHHLDPGTYQLVVVLPQERIVIPVLTLQAGED
jgi:hypothetical protein